LKKYFEKNCEKKFAKKLLENKFQKIKFFEFFLQKKTFEKKFVKKYIFEKNFAKNYFSKKIWKKNFVKFFLPTLVKVSSSGLKLKENEILLL